MQEMQFLPLGQEDSPRVGNGKLQYSCLYNPIDRGAWWAAENGVTRSWTRLSNMAQLTSKRSQSEKATYCRTPTVWQSREGNAETTKGRWWLGLGREEGVRDRAQRIFRAVKISCMAPSWWIHVLIHLSKLIEWRISRELWCRQWALGD